MPQVGAEGTHPTHRRQTLKDRCWFLYFFFLFGLLWEWNLIDVLWASYVSLPLYTQASKHARTAPLFWSWLSKHWKGSQHHRNLVAHPLFSLFNFANIFVVWRWWRISFFKLLFLSKTMYSGVQ